jgi:hypothetical protein
MPETKRHELTRSLLQSTGILTQLKAACLTLVGSDPELIRSMTLAVTCDGAEEEADEAVIRLAEEHCVVASVERTAGALIVRLKRRDDARPFGGSVRQREHVVKTPGSFWPPLGFSSWQLSWNISGMASWESNLLTPDRAGTPKEARRR